MTGSKKKRKEGMSDIRIMSLHVFDLNYFTLQFYPTEIDTRFAYYMTHICYLNLSSFQNNRTQLITCTQS